MTTRRPPTTQSSAQSSSRNRSPRGRRRIPLHRSRRCRPLFGPFRHPFYSSTTVESQRFSRPWYQRQWLIRNDFRGNRGGTDSAPSFLGWQNKKLRLTRRESRWGGRIFLRGAIHACRLSLLSTCTTCCTCITSTERAEDETGDGPFGRSRCRARRAGQFDVGIVVTSTTHP